MLAFMKRFLLSLLSIFIGLNGAPHPYQDIFDACGVSVDRAADLWIQSGKERWEYDKRYEYLRPTLWPLFEKAGLLFEAAPQKERYDYALVYGALLSKVKSRIDYLSSLCKKGVSFKQFIFLTGERPLLASEKARCGFEWEWEMVEWAYLHSDLPRDVPVVFIRSPGKWVEGKWVRPQTRDTVISWKETSPNPGSCLGISNQPYVGYQNAVMRSLLPADFEVETAGAAIDGEPSVALILDTIAKQLLNESVIK